MQVMARGDADWTIFFRCLSVPQEMMSAAGFV